MIFNIPHLCEQDSINPRRQKKIEQLIIAYHNAIGWADKKLQPEFQLLHFCMPINLKLWSLRGAWLFAFGGITQEPPRQFAIVQLVLSGIQRTERAQQEQIKAKRKSCELNHKNNLNYDDWSAEKNRTAAVVALSVIKTKSSAEKKREFMQKER